MKFKIESFEGDNIVVLSAEGEKIIMAKSELSAGKNIGDEIELDPQNHKNILNQLLKS